MTIWNSHHHPSSAGLRAALGYIAAAVISLAVWIALASFMG